MERAWKRIRHFARCLVKQVEDFRSTDKWVDAPDFEGRRKFNHATWNNYANPYCLPEDISVLYGYIDMNMLLLDEAKWREERREARMWGWDELAGQHDRGHPEWLARPFREEILNGNEIRRLDHEGAEALRNHAKRLFQVMYRSPSVSVERIVEWLQIRYRLPAPPQISKDVHEALPSEPWVGIGAHKSMMKGRNDKAKRRGRGKNGQRKHTHLF